MSGRSSDLPDRPVGLLLEPRKPAHPDDWRWCGECDGYLKHEPTCSLVQEAHEYAAGLAELTKEETGVYGND